jgi:hypothetical protein
MLKTAGIIVIVALATLGAGWIWGASGRGDIDRARRAAELRAEFAEARASLLEARVSLFKVNFGDAGRAFDDARARVSGLQTRLREAGQAERAGRLEIVLAHIGDAGRLTLALDARAQAAADGALAALSAAATP